MSDASRWQRPGDGLLPTPDAMKQAFRRLLTGVTLVTVRDRQDRCAGMTANAVAPVSLDPPSVLVCINCGTRTWELVREQCRFGISILNEGQRQIAEYGARPGVDKWLDSRWIDRRLASDAPPAIAGALSHLDCVVDQVLVVGTHAIVVGRVQEILMDGGNAPLMYFQGAYRQLDPSPDRRYEAFWELFDRHGY